MVKVFFGPKGTGKTKLLIEKANEYLENRKGDIVFIDNTNELMYRLKHKIRFIDISEYHVSCPKTMLGFICGILAQNYDIEGIFIDRLTYIIGNEGMEEFLNGLETIAAEKKVDFYISISGEIREMPHYIKKFTV